MADFKENLTGWSASGEKLQRSALGRTGFIGELYDARTEMFSSRSLFSSSFPKDFVQTQQNCNSEINYSYSDRLSERFSVLKIEADLQLPILFNCASFNLSGSGKYLNEEKKSERTVSCSLVYDVSTFCDKLIAPFNEVVEYIDEGAFSDYQYTHVVSEIHWGAKCTLTLEHHIADLNRNTEAEGNLKGQLKMLASLIEAGGSGKVNYKDLENEELKKVHFKMHGDVLPGGRIPNTVEDAVDFISKIPEYLKDINNGKGKPLSYGMIPIDTFKKLRKADKIITVMLVSLDESFVMELIYFFQEIEILKQKLNDLENDLAAYKKYLPGDCLSRIRTIQLEIKKSEVKLKTSLAKDWPLVRSGKIEMNDLTQKAEKLKSTNLDETKIKNLIEEFEPIRRKIDFIGLCLSKKVNYLGKDDNFELIMNTNIGDDFFVMYISEELSKKNRELFRENLNFLLSETENADANSHYIIVDFDIIKEIPCEVSEVKIMQYKNSAVVAYDVCKEYKAKSSTNIAKLKNPTDMNHCQKKPHDLVMLKLICPGSITGTCQKDLLMWKCNICNENLKYDLGNNFYCICGKAESHLYEFKCSSLRHGDEFLSVGENFPLMQELNKLKPVKETPMIMPSPMPTPMPMPIIGNQVGMRVIRAVDGLIPELNILRGFRY